MGGADRPYRPRARGRHPPRTCRSGENRHGAALLLERIFPDGGWNCGPPRVPGYDADSYPETTGLAARLSAQAYAWLTLALAAHGSFPRNYRARPHSRLRSLHLPHTALRCDLLVSIPKMKTQHWAGATYGWPKNVLHWAGIPECAADLHALFPRHFAIVDGIVGMGGDGPIQGTPRSVRTNFEPIPQFSGYWLT